MRRVQEETSSVPWQSGLGNEWWADFTECYCYLRNIQDLLSDGLTLNGPGIPFGAMVEYHPASAKDQSGLHQFGAKVLPGIFLGYMHYTRRESGKETLWSQTLKHWRRWTHLNSTPQGSMQRKCQRQ